MEQLTVEPHKIWIEQCDAARGIEAEFGTQQALAYLIDEKFINFLEAAETDEKFRAEIPAFVADIKSIFEPWQRTAKNGDIPNLRCPALPCSFFSVAN